MKFQTVLASAGRRDHPLLPPLGVVGTMGPIAPQARAAGGISSGAGAGEELPENSCNGTGGVSAEIRKRVQSFQTYGVS